MIQNNCTQNLVSTGRSNIPQKSIVTGVQVCFSCLKVLRHLINSLMILHFHILNTCRKKYFILQVLQVGVGSDQYLDEILPKGGTVDRTGS